MTTFTQLELNVLLTALQNKDHGDYFDKDQLHQLHKAAKHFLSNLLRDQNDNE